MAILNQPLHSRIVPFVNHLLVGLLLALAVSALVQFGEYLLAPWRGGYLIPFAFLTAIVSIYSLHLARDLDAWSREWLILHITEWVVLIAALKLTTYSVRGWSALQTDLRLWQENFMDNFLDSYFFLAAFVIGFVWILARLMAIDLARLEVDEKILDQEIASSIYEERAVARRDLSYLILSIGASMVVLLAFQSLDISASGGPATPPASSIVAILLYFVLALVMLSLTQLSMLRIRWTIAHIPVSTQIASRWIVYALSFLVLTSVVALLLPTRYSVGLLDLLRMLFMMIIGVLALLMFLVTLPFIFIYGWLAQLIGRPVPLPRFDFERLIPAQPSPVPSTSIPLIEWLKSFLFWAIFIAIIGFSVYSYLKDRKELLDRLRRVPLLRNIFKLVGTLRAWWSGVSENVSSAVRSRRQRLRPHGETSTPFSWRFTSLRRLTPRQRVLFYYLAMVRRGSENGLPRHPAQTPREYSARLEGRLPEVEESIHDLTSEFVEARYSLHEIHPQAARLVQSQWERIRQAFRRTFRH